MRVIRHLGVFRTDVSAKCERHANVARKFSSRERDVCWYEADPRKETSRPFSLSYFIVIYFHYFSFAGQFLCRDLKIQVLPAAFYLNESVNFKQSATGKMTRDGQIC